MYRLYWIRFCDREGRLLVRQDYSGLIFKSERWVLAYVEHEKHRFQGVFDKELYEDPYYKQIPRIDQVDDVVGLVCRYKDLPIEGVKSKIRRRDFAYARKIISNLCLDRGLTHNVIAQKTGFNRSLIYNHQKTLANLLETDKDMRKEYEAIDKFITKHLNSHD